MIDNTVAWLFITLISLTTLFCGVLVIIACHIAGLILKMYTEYYKDKSADARK